MLRMVAVFVFVAITFYSFSLSAAKVPLGQFPRVSSNSLCSNSQRLTFGERISCITRDDDFSAEKSSSGLTASCSFPKRLQRQRLTSSSWSNEKLVILLSSDPSQSQIRILIEKNFFSF